MKRFVLLIISVVLLGACVSDGEPVVSHEGYSVEFMAFENQDWITISGVELFQDEDSLYVKCFFEADEPGLFSLFNPPSGSKFMIKGDLPADNPYVINKIEKAHVQDSGEVTMLFFPGSYHNEGRSTGFFFKTENITFSKVPLFHPEVNEVYQEKNVVNKNEEKEFAITGLSDTGTETSPAEFKAARPWLLDDASVMDNPDFDSHDRFSSRFLIYDNFNHPIELNPDYLGEWKSYGNISTVELPASEINGEQLYELFRERGDKEDRGNWRGIRFNDDGTVETDSGNQTYGYVSSEFWGTEWTDGWVLSKSRRVRSHALVIEVEEGTLLFYELKNGDYLRGRAPSYVVFRKE